MAYEKTSRTKSPPSQAVNAVTPLDRRAALRLPAGGYAGNITRGLPLNGTGN